MFISSWQIVIKFSAIHNQNFGGQILYYVHYTCYAILALISSLGSRKKKKLAIAS